MYIRKGDTVEILSGDDKGKRGKVLSVDRKDGMIVVEGVNRVYKHMKPNRRNQQGGRLSKEMPIHACKASLIDPSTNTASKTAVRYLEDGTKELYFKKSKVALRPLSKARPKYAKA